MKANLLLGLLTSTAVAVSATAQHEADAAPPRRIQSTGSFQLVWSGVVIDVFMLGDLAWTVEDGGRIRHRDAEGQWTFQEVPSEVKEALLRIHFLSDGLHGWAVGQGGWLISTANGGETWEIVGRMPGVLDPSAWEELFDVYFLDEQQGWILGKHGIWITTDGGAGWTTLRLLDRNGIDIDPATIELYALDFLPGACVHDCACPGPPCPCPPSPNYGLACGEPGLVFRTLDGIVWQVVFDARDECPCRGGAGLISTCAQLQEMCADPSDCAGKPPHNFEPWDLEIRDSIDQPLALVVGGVVHQCGMVFASDDWGCSWVQEPHACDLPGVDCPKPKVFGPPARHDGYRTLYGVGIFDGDGSAIAGGYQGQHIRRPAGPAGQAWRDHSVFGSVFRTDTVAYAQFGADADEGSFPTGRGWLVGMGNHLRRTTDGGKTYAEEGLSPSEEFRVHDVFFYGADSGWQVGQFFRLALSTDGGKSYDPVSPAPQFDQPYLHAVTMAANAMNGVAVGDSPDESSTPKILWTQTNDAWHTPTAVVFLSAPGGPGEEVFYRNKNLWEVDWARDAQQLDFWAVGDDGLILHSRNGGKTWAQFLPPGETTVLLHRFDLTSVSFSAPGVGIFVGRRPYPTIDDPPRGVAYLYRASSGTWTDLTPSDPKIFFLTDVDTRGTQAYAVGTKRVGSEKRGVILTSTGARFVEVQNAPTITECDIGANPTQVEPLTEVEIASPSSVWIGGQCGRVWQFDGSSWTEYKSQTDSHVWGMSFPTADRGYVACHRENNTQSAIVRYDRLP
jgi:photosystem II stability/assembly factor-like uncharacterized protein